MRFKYSGAFVRQMAAGLIIAGQLGFAVGLGSALDGPIGFFSAALMVTAMLLGVERQGYIIPCSFALTLGGLAALLHDLLPSSGLDDTLFALVCTITGLGCLFFRTNGLRTEYMGLTSLLALLVYAEYSAFDASTAALLFGESGHAATLLQLWGGKIVVWMGMIAVAALAGLRATGHILRWLRSSVRLFLSCCPSPARRLSSCCLPGSGWGGVRRQLSAFSRSSGPLAAFIMICH